MNFARKKVSIIFLALFLIFCYSSANGVAVCFGGMGSAEHATELVALIFATGFSGAGFTTTLLSASVWNRMLYETQSNQNQSLITKIMIGKYPLISIIMYSAPIVLDIVAIITAITYVLIPPSIETSYIAIAYSFVEFGTGAYFFVSNVRFQRELKLISKNSHNQKTDAVETASRMFKTVMAIVASMFIYVIGTAIMGFARDFWLTPEGWVLAWSIAMTGYEFHTLFHLFLFRPVWNKGQHGVTPNEVSKKNAQAYTKIFIAV